MTNSIPTPSLTIDKPYLRLAEVLKIVPVSRNTWNAGVKAGRFPQPIQLGERIKVWCAFDIQQLMQAQCPTEKQ